jgi:uncharacterized membrane protein HdeD (DUF308 family)
MLDLAQGRETAVRRYCGAEEAQRMWKYRLSGSILALSGLAILLYLSYAFYTRTAYGLIVLVRLGMPTVLLATFVGAVLVASGVWLIGFWHPAQDRISSMR